MQVLAPGLSYVDLMHQGLPRIIASALVQSAGGIALIDPGPASCLPVLERALEARGLTLADLTAILVTHIHLDHSGATGSILRLNPRVTVYVHEQGAPHLVAPEKLVASATRLWGAAMQTLWGEVLPVPTSAIRTLAGGEQIDVAGRRFDVAYTPGHASHHVSYLNRDTGVAFVGDTAGVCLSPGGYVVPPTPPPDIDLELWRRSLATIAAWRPDTLFMTHFGPTGPVAAHLATLEQQLDLAARLVRESLAREGDDAAREAWFGEALVRDLCRSMSEADAAAYNAAGQFELGWRGLARYYRKRPA